MPGSYLIDPAQSLVFSKGWGVLTDEELHWHGESLRAHPRFSDHLARTRARRRHRRFRTPVRRIVEIRSYNLKPGRRDEFHRLVVEESLPLVRNRGVDVVDFGPSPHDENSYYLIRAYASLADRVASHEAFYGSPEWRRGPRAAILALIESDTSIVLELDASTIDLLRRPRP